jgi:hypothetical protein
MPRRLSVPSDCAGGGRRPPSGRAASALERRAASAASRSTTPDHRGQPAARCGWSHRAQGARPDRRTLGRGGVSRVNRAGIAWCRLKLQFGDIRTVVGRPEDRGPGGAAAIRSDGCRGEWPWCSWASPWGRSRLAAAVPGSWPRCLGWREAAEFWSSGGWGPWAAGGSCCLPPTPPCARSASSLPRRAGPDAGGCFRHPGGRGGTGCCGDGGHLCRCGDRGPGRAVLKPDPSPVRRPGADNPPARLCRWPRQCRGSALPTPPLSAGDVPDPGPAGPGPDLG